MHVTAGQPCALHDLIRDAGFAKPIVRVGARRTGDPFTVLIAAGTKSPG